MIVGGTILGFNLKVCAIFSELIQNIEGSDSSMKLRMVDTAELKPNKKLQGGMGCFSLAQVKVFSRNWKDAKVDAMLVNAIKHMNCITKK